MSSTNENLQTPEKKKIKISSYVALFLTLAFLSGEPVIITDGFKKTLI